MKNTPNLRFQDFSEEWEKYVLGNIFDFYTTNSFSRDFLDNDKGTVKNIHYGDIHMRFPTLLDVQHTAIPYVKEEINLSKISPDSYCKDGDVIIADASEDYNDIGKAIELKNIGVEKVISGLHTILARDHKEVMVNGFRGYLMSSPSVRKQIKVYAAGAKVLGISKANISKVNLFIPSRIEQEKIASFFSLIDKKIGLQTEKVEELKNYKKGIMQKIFSQELRFKDENGNNYPEWKKKKIKDIDLFISDGNYGESYPTSCDMVEEGIPFLRGNNISDGYLNFNDMKYITPEKHSELLSGHLKEKDIVITVRGDIGKVGFATAEYEGANMNAQLALIRVNCDNINPRYIHQYMTTTEFYKEVLKRQTGTALKQLPIGNLKDIFLKLPTEVEQRKIASILCKLDNKIKKEQEKLELLNRYKIGFLQHMFV